MRIKVVLVAISICMLFSCKAKKISSLNVHQGSEEEYIATFTEATKYALLGNYKNAVGLFNLCIEKFPERAGPYYQLSNIYYSFKDISNAKKFGRKAVDLNDENIWYLLHLSNIYHYEKNIDTMIYLYEKIVKISDNPEYKYNLSVFYSQNGDMKKSMRIVNELEKEIPDAQEILRLKHMNYSAMKMQDSAIAQLEKLVRLFPSDIDNYGLLAEYLSEINKFQDAKKIYQELLEFEPDNGLANFSYGDFFLKQGKRDSALFYYRKGFIANDIGVDDKIGLVMNFMYDPILLRSDTIFIESLIDILKINYPEFSQTYTVSAEYNIKRQKYSAAVVDLEDALIKGNDSEIVWEQYIMLCGMLKKYEKVDSIYQKAVKKFPDNMNICIYSSYALYELKEVDKLISLCDSAIIKKNIKMDEKTQLMNFIADGYRWKKDYHKSDSVFDAILKIDSDNLIVRNNYAYYLSLRNVKLDKALELSRFTVEKEPNNPTFLDTYGWILFVKGNYKDSFKYIEKAIRNGANRNPEVLDHYGDVLQKMNMCKEAIEAWNHAIKYSETEIQKYSEKIKNAEEVCK